ncbi:MAG TPA: DUF559 domain-containing protein [Marisediminicola sp.]|jgi:very-short-patch-repair endonuclease|nr:DUF559 domain-containing protein [Marisediminicola sp.]
MHLTNTLAQLGYLASRRQLADLGFGRRAIDRALAGGVLLPVRPGWVATTQANQLAVIAVLNGARLTGGTALRSFGIWDGLDQHVHLQLPANSHRIIRSPSTPIGRFTPPRFPPGPLVIEWAAAARADSHSPQWRVSVTDAIVRFARVESDEQVAAAIESAVHEKRMRRAEVSALMERLPRRFRRILTSLNFKAESGLESIGVLRFEDLGYDVAQQVQIGPDRVDIVLDGWLIIELDGDAHHDVARDRKRTNRLIRAGYSLLRFGYVDVFFEWDATLALVQQVRGERTFAQESAVAGIAF